MPKQTITDVKDLVVELHDAARHLLKGHQEPIATGLALHQIADHLAGAVRHLEIAEATRGAGRE